MALYAIWLSSLSPAVQAVLSFLSVGLYSWQCYRLYYMSRLKFYYREGKWFLLEENGQVKQVQLTNYFVTRLFIGLRFAAERRKLPSRSEVIYLVRGAVTEERWRQLRRILSSVNSD